MHMRRKKIICLDQLDVAVDYIGLPELDRSRAFEGCVCVERGGGGGGGAHETQLTRGPREAKQNTTKK